MAIHPIASTARWTERLAETLDTCAEGDIIVCSDGNMAELARGYLSRSPYKHVRFTYCTKEHGQLALITPEIFERDEIAMLETWFNKTFPQS